MRYGHALPRKTWPDSPIDAPKAVYPILLRKMPSFFLLRFYADGVPAHLGPCAHTSSDNTPGRTQGFCHGDADFLLAFYTLLSAFHGLVTASLSLKGKKILQNHPHTPRKSTTVFGSEWKNVGQKCLSELNACKWMQLNFTRFSWRRKLKTNDLIMHVWMCGGVQTTQTKWMTIFAQSSRQESQSPPLEHTRTKGK